MIGNCALVGAGLLMGLLISEGMLRIAFPESLQVTPAFRTPPWAAWADPAWSNPPDEAYRPDPILVYENAPGVDVPVALAERDQGVFRFRTNNLGLRRDTDTTETKPPSTYRVLVLGDSHASGYVDNVETFSSLLESKLTEHLVTAHRIEVLNGAVVGYSPAQEVLWYRTRGKAMNPDVVVLVFYAGNDAVELEDPYKPDVDTTTGEAIPPRQAPARGENGPARFVDTTRGGLRVAALARWAVSVGPLASLWHRVRGPDAEAAGFSLNDLSAVLRTCHGCFWQSLQQAAFARRDPESMERAISRAADLIVALDREIRAHNSSFLAVLLPSRVQVDPEHATPELDRAARRLGVEWGPTPFENEVTARLRATLEGAGVDVLDLLNDLRMAATVAPQYYSRDWHLNGMGHQTVAVALDREIMRRALLPSVGLKAASDSSKRSDIGQVAERVPEVR
jgi:hypothetical protein